VHRMFLVATPADIALTATLGALGLAQHRVAQLFGVGPRSVRRWRDGTRHTPRGVDIVLRLVAEGVVTIDQIEKVAIPAPVRANGNGSAHPELVEPVSAPSTTLAHIETATLVDPDLTTAEKVYALTSKSCRWPHGDPKHSDFHFCGNPIVHKSYCQYHRALAYMPTPTRAGRLPVTWRRLALS